MKTLKLVSLSLLTTSLLFTACIGLKIPIDKNKLVSNVEIEFVSKNLKLKQNDVFNLSETGLKSTILTFGSNSLYTLQKLDIGAIIKGCKNGNYTNYDILIKSPNYSKPYYGKIAFFNVSGQGSETAVSRYREISVDEKYFASATRGRTAIMYEYAEQKYLNGTMKNPTWFILMSDEPF